MRTVRPMVVASVLACAGLFLACASSSSPTPSGGGMDAAIGETGAVDSAYDAGVMQTVCDELGAPKVAAAPLVVPTKVGIATLPAAQGGTIADGTYQLTSISMYTDNTSFPAGMNKGVATFKGDKFVSVRTVGSDLDDGRNIGGTYSTANKVITLKVSCQGRSSSPSGFVPAKNTYTATPTTFTDYYEIRPDDGTPGSRLVAGEVWTKQ